MTLWVFLMAWGVLLQPGDCAEENSVGRRSSLAEYLAQHWVTHAQFENVSLSLRKAMEYLFDHILRLGSTSIASPLYYAALCGFQDLAEHLVVKHPQYVNM